MNVPDTTPPIVDMLIVGGGINGAGIARDAAGRDLRVAICDAGDFGGATSSASTKLIHGGLRYLEHFAFRLVAESLAERETLGRIAVHLVQPLRFVMPHTPQLRPAWMIQAGLYLYDHLGGVYDRDSELSLPASARIDLSADRAGYGEALRADIGTAFVYSDLAVDDARLVIANLRSAAALGARILPRTRLVAAHRQAGNWHAELVDSDSGAHREIAARVLINAAGPWVSDVIGACVGIKQDAKVRLVKGSHLVLPRLYAGEHAYLLQNDDRRIVFLIPYRQHFTLLGTTEVSVGDTRGDDGVSADETAYLLAAANRYLKTPVSPAQIVHSFCGYRPLYDDGRQDPSAVTRDYTLLVDNADDAPYIAIFGGKLTTFRRLAETVISSLPKHLRGQRGAWTRTARLPGSDGFSSASETRTALARRYPWLAAAYLAALVDRYGACVPDVIGAANGMADLGRRFGDLLSEREIDYLVGAEWARRPDDILWRRSKAGLEMSAAERNEFAEWFDGWLAARRDEQESAGPA